MNDRSTAHLTKAKILENFEYEVDEYDVRCGYRERCAVVSSYCSTMYGL